jgi:prepilin-type N-terminal cleavage/methylation domain-containing protein
MIRIPFKRVGRNHGFTLGEVVVALSIASIVASLALPASGKLLNQYRLSSAVSQLKMEVARARMQAIGQHRYVRLKKTSAGFIREVSSDNVNFTQNGGASATPQGVTVTFGSGGGPKFNRQGLTSSISYAVVSNPQGYKVVSVNVLGRVDVL